MRQVHEGQEPEILDSGDIPVRVIRGPAGLDELKDIWESIPIRWPGPMRSFDWVRVCAEIFDMEDLMVVVAGEPPSIAVAPLYQLERAGGPLELIGARQLFEVTDFIYTDSSALVTLASAVARARFPVSFWRIPADSPSLAALKEAFRWRGAIIVRPASGCPWIPLDESWLDPESQLVSRRRSELRRARRIAESHGAVQSEVLTPDVDNLESLLDEAFAVEAASWKGREGTALAQDELRGAFYRRYAAAAAEEGILRLCFLRIDGQAVAMQLALETGGSFWLLKIGYDREFARCSPGTLLLVEAIRHSAEAGLRSFEFLGGEESWISVWTSNVRPCVSVVAYPIGLRGAAALARDALALGRDKVRSGLQGKG